MMSPKIGPFWTPPLPCHPCHIFVPPWVTSFMNKILHQNMCKPNICIHVFSNHIYRNINTKITSCHLCQGSDKEWPLPIVWSVTLSLFHCPPPPPPHMSLNVIFWLTPPPPSRVTLFMDSPLVLLLLMHLQLKNTCQIFPFLQKIVYLI